VILQYIVNKCMFWVMTIITYSLRMEVTCTHAYEVHVVSARVDTRKL